VVLVQAEKETASASSKTIASARKALFFMVTSPLGCLLPDSPAVFCCTTNDGYPLVPPFSLTWQTSLPHDDPVWQADGKPFSHAWQTSLPQPYTS
jgi:hypothetical protein